MWQAVFLTASVLWIMDEALPDCVHVVCAFRQNRHLCVFIYICKICVFVLLCVRFHVCMCECLVTAEKSMPTLSMWSSTSCWVQLSIFCSTFLTVASTSTMLSLVMLAERIGRVECKRIALSQQTYLRGKVVAWEQYFHWTVTDAHRWAL